MHVSKAFFALAALAVSALALPVDGGENELLERDSTYICKPKENNSTVKTFTVSDVRAVTQAAAGDFEPGKSGDPHKYGNGDDIRWGVNGCNKNKNQLWECKWFARFPNAIGESPYTIPIPCPLTSLSSLPPFYLFFLT